jgi:hypothetical protein
MPHRNDDPPEDRAAELQADMEEAVYEELSNLPICGPLDDIFNFLTAYVCRKMNEAYTNGYVDGRADQPTENSNAS